MRGVVNSTFTSQTKVQLGPPDLQFLSAPLHIGVGYDGDERWAGRCWLRAKVMSKTVWCVGRELLTRGSCSNPLQRRKWRCSWDHMASGFDIKRWRLVLGIIGTISGPSGAGFTSRSV